MDEVGVLAILVSRRCHVQRASFLVDVRHVFGYVLTLVDLVLERPVRPVQIVVTPSIALRPPDQLGAVIEDLQGLRLDVDVHPLLNDRLHLPRRDVERAEVEPVQVAAHAGEIQLVGVGTLPDGLGLVPLPLARRGLVHLDLDALILERRRLRDRPCLGRDLKGLELELGRVRFSRHRVRVCLEGRARVGERVDHPQLRDLALVAAQQREPLRVARPGQVRRRAGIAILLPLAFADVLLLFLLLFLLLILAAAGPAAAVREVLDTVGGNLRLDDRLVGGVLLRLDVVRRIHHPEIPILDVNYRLSVRRHRRPRGLP